MALFTATEAPEKPARSPESSAWSGANTSRSQRLSVPTLTPMPSVAHGDFQPYLPRSPVTSNSKMLSSVLTVRGAGLGEEVQRGLGDAPCVKML